MKRLEKFILESLYGDGDNGIIEFSYGDMRWHEVEQKFPQLKEEMKQHGIDTVVNYPNVAKITVITTKEKAQVARNLAELQGFIFLKEIFDTRPQEIGDKTPGTDNMNSTFGNGFKNLGKF